MNNKDKEFIMNVRKKINYIEYIKLEEEKVKHYKKMKIKRNIKIVANASILLFIMSISLLIPESLYIICMLILGMYILGFCCYYENCTKEENEWF